MRTWAFVSQKGGSGKSTLSTQLAVYAEECGENVCLADLDPQASAIAWANVRGSRQPGVLAATPEKIADLVAQGPNFNFTLLLIDTAPHTDAGALASIRAADLVICPTQSSLFDVVALKDTVRLLDLCDARHKAVCVINGLPHQGAKEAYEEAVQGVESLGLKALASPVSHRRPFVQAITKGKGVTETVRTAPAATEIRTLWNELNKLHPIIAPTAVKEKAQ